MIDAIRLNNYKGIKEVFLTQLGQINVLSGKNNSGKSSVLECATRFGGKFKQGNCAIAWEFNEAIISELTDQYLAKSNNSHRQKHLRAALERLRGEYCYDNGMDGVIQKLYSVTRDFGGEGFGPLYFQNFYKRKAENLVAFYEPLLIPAKRAVSQNPLMSAQTDMEASGGNMICYLFYLKNQPPNSILLKQFQQISSSFCEISGGVYFDISSTSKGGLALRFSHNQSEWLEAESWGMGLQDLLCILSLVISRKESFVMIEEPENHMHPDMQRKLLQFLRRINNKQFLIASHSNVFLDPAGVDRMFLVEKKEHVGISDKTGKAQILKELGYSVVDNFVSDLIVLTEGPTDTEVVEEICRKLGFWDNHNIKFWPLGGNIMERIDLSALLDNISSSRLMALIDQDPESSTSRDKFKAQCARLGIECTQLERYAIENYIPLSVIKAHPRIKVKTEVGELRKDIKVEKQLGVGIKKYLRELSRETKIEEIKDTDLLRFCESMEKRLVENG